MGKLCHRGRSTTILNTACTQQVGLHGGIRQPRQNWLGFIRRDGGQQAAQLFWKSISLFVESRLLKELEGQAQFEMDSFLPQSTIALTTGSSYVS